MGQGGQNPPGCSRFFKSETYDGTSWTEGNNLNTLEDEYNAAGAGTTTAAG